MTELFGSVVFLKWLLGSATAPCWGWMSSVSSVERLSGCVSDWGTPVTSDLPAWPARAAECSVLISVTAMMRL